jgi:hypothetical protein
MMGITTGRIGMLLVAKNVVVILHGVHVVSVTLTIVMLTMERVCVVNFLIDRR